MTKLTAPPRRPRAGLRPAAVPPDRAALAARFGGIDPARVRLDPPPGTATVADMERVRRETDRLCEILDGTLVEKAVSWFASQVAMELVGILQPWLKAHLDAEGRRRGYLAGPDGFFRLEGEAMVTPRLRAPDVSYLDRHRFPGGRFPRTGYPTVSPDLVVEVLFPSNTAGEMRQKRANFFAAGTVRIWQIDPIAETAEMFDPADPDAAVPVPADGTLDAGPALPGFAVRLADLFTERDGAE